MAISNIEVGSIRWEIKEFRDKWRKNKDFAFLSDNFFFRSSHFSLFYNPVDLWEGDVFGIILQYLIGKRPLEVNLKIWFENSKGRKFQEYSVQKHTFGKLVGYCKFELKLSDADHSPLSNVYMKNESLYICCEITDHQATVPKPDLTQQFFQDMWSMYEQEVHDTIIKVGQTEFKILKAFFISHSEVFKSMFTLDFKESKTNTVEINDVSEQAMKLLTKWMYTYQIDDESAIENLYEAADKYQVHLLKTNCSELMTNSLDNSNVFCRLILAVAHNDNQLKDAALEYINKMPQDEAMIYFTSSAWLELGQKNSVFVKEVNKLIGDKLKK